MRQNCFSDPKWTEMGFYFCLEFAGSRGIENSLKDGAQEPYRCALDQIVSSMSVMFAHPYIPGSFGRIKWRQLRFRPETHFRFRPDQKSLHLLAPSTRSAERARYERPLLKKNAPPLSVLYGTPWLYTYVVMHSIVVDWYICVRHANVDSQPFEFNHRMIGDYPSSWWVLQYVLTRQAKGNKQIVQPYAVASAAVAIWNDFVTANTDSLAANQSPYSDFVAQGVPKTS